MSTIPNLGASREPGNPLTLLAEKMDALTEVIREGMTRHGQHTYGILNVNPGQWLVYCLGCSAAQERYVHPCVFHQHGKGEIPPSGFNVEPSSAEQS